VDWQISRGQSARAWLILSWFLVITQPLRILGALDSEIKSISLLLMLDENYIKIQDLLAAFPLI